MSQLTVVVDNTSYSPDLIPEWGLSLWIEHAEKNILMDTGNGQNLIRNLDVLGLDPLRADFVVLSHGHYDHTGGLEAFLRRRKESGLATPVWCHEDLFSEHLKELDDGSIKNVGNPLPDQASYEALGAEFHLVEGAARPVAGMTLLAPIPRRTSFEGPPPSLVTRISGEIAPDPIKDDLSLMVETDDRLNVITGCAHAGVVNVLLAAEEASGKKAGLVLGGTHLGPAPQAQREQAVAELKSREGLLVAACHCNGAEGARVMREELGERFLPIGAGLTLRL